MSQDQPPDTPFPDSIQWAIEAARSPKRPAGTLASRVTSVDCKLAYDEHADEFVSVVLSDCNANPEGVSLVHESADGQSVCNRVARAYAGGNGRATVAVWLPTSVWDDGTGEWVDPDSWLTRDRRDLVAAIQRLDSIEAVVRCSYARSLRVEGDFIVYTGPDTREPVTIDRYINLEDTGTDLADALGRDVTRYAHGVNAPSAVWCPRVPETGKPALARALSELVPSSQGVLTPRHTRVETLTDLDRFRAGIDSPVVVKDPYGTWGDGVVEIRTNSGLESTIRQEEQAVRSAREWPEYSLLADDGERFSINSRGYAVPYAHAAEAVQGRLERPNASYRVVAVPPRIHPFGEYAPIDFVALALAEAEERVTVPSTVVRVSGKPGLNGNPRFRYINDMSVPIAMSQDMAVPNPANLDESFAFHLGDVLEEIAGRPVPADEITATLRAGAEIGLAARNLTAFRAEQQLTNGKH